MTKTEIIANRNAKQEELRRLKRRETPFLAAAGELGQLDPKCIELQREIDATFQEEREAS